MGTPVGVESPGMGFAPPTQQTDTIQDEAIPSGAIQLPANQPTGRFYRGGRRISEFRGDPPSAPHTPEDWVGSTTPVRGQTPLGLTVLPNGIRLVDAIAGAPELWLGSDHVRSFGTDSRLLVKLLDPGQRLPVHAHPDAAFADRYLGAHHGKAEAWYLLSPGTLYLGLRRDVSLNELQKVVANQDLKTLLQLMHQIHLEAGQTVYVPPGLLHAIGEGVFLIEVQEPEDLSILLEWQDFELDGWADGHLGLGFDTALTAVETTCRTIDAINALVTTPNFSQGCLPPEAATYFRLDRLVVTETAAIDQGFAIVIVLDGNLDLLDAAGQGMGISVGTTTLLPHVSGPWRLTGSGTVLLARPPAPTTPPDA